MPIYMKYEGIQGPVTGKYKGWISLESCQLGTSRPGGGTNSEITVTKSQDSSSTQLFRESLNGVGKKATIDFVKGEEAPYMSIELENTLISSYSISGNGGSDTRPMESLTLNYTKISYSTKPTASAQDANDTKDRAMWDLAVSE